MPNIFKGLIEGGIKGIGDTAKGIIQQIAENKMSAAEGLLNIEKEANRASEEGVRQANDLEKAYLVDAQNARGRESEFVKATGHIDYMQMTIGLLVMITFIVVVWFVATRPLPEGSEHLLINAMGILEGMVLAVVGYYYGSSAGSRIKDMKK